MKKISLVLISLVVLAACNSDQGGVVNDGNKVMLRDSASKDTTRTNQPALDTSKMKDRVDLQQRDTFRPGK